MAPKREQQAAFPTRPCTGPTCTALIMFLPRQGGKFAVVDAKGARRWVMDRDGTARQAVTYMPHHATCPDREHFRELKKDAP